LQLVRMFSVCTCHISRKQNARAVRNMHVIWCSVASNQGGCPQILMRTLVSNCVCVCDESSPRPSSLDVSSCTCRATGVSLLSPRTCSWRVARCRKRAKSSGRAPLASSRPTVLAPSSRRSVRCVSRSWVSTTCPRVTSRSVPRMPCALTGPCKCCQRSLMLSLHYLQDSHAH